MKLIIAIISNEDAAECISALTKKRLKVTRLATSGGFLRAGNTTLLCGLEEEKVDMAIDIIREYSQKRDEYIESGSGFSLSGINAYPVTVQAGGAIIFVVDVEQYIKI